MAFSGMTYGEAIIEVEAWLEATVGDFFQYVDCEEVCVVLYAGPEVKHNACGFCADRIKFFGTGFRADDIEYMFSRYSPHCRDREDYVEAMNEDEPKCETII